MRDTRLLEENAFNILSKHALPLPARSWTDPHTPPHAQLSAEGVDATKTKREYSTPIKQSRSHYCANANMA